MNAVWSVLCWFRYQPVALHHEVVFVCGAHFGHKFWWLASDLLHKLRILLNNLYWDLFCYSVCLKNNSGLCKNLEHLFHTVVRWHKLSDTENECILHDFIVLAIFLPEIIKFSEHLTKLWDCFFWDTVYTHNNFRSNLTKKDQCKTFAKCR